MSRLGKKSIPVPSGVTVAVASGVVSVQGPKGKLSLTLLQGVTVKIEPSPTPPVGGSEVLVERTHDEREDRARHGLTRMLIANMVHGVSQGYEKRLEIIGVGYKAQAKGSSITLQLGFSHPIEYKAPQGVDIRQDEENKQILIITGIDKQLVGQVAADLRNKRPPEPYKGKGIRY